VDRGVSDVCVQEQQTVVAGRLDTGPKRRSLSLIAGQPDDFVRARTAGLAGRIIARAVIHDHYLGDARYPARRADCLRYAVGCLVGRNHD
jgi:hypothetical protein